MLPLSSYLYPREFDSVLTFAGATVYALFLLGPIYAVGMADMVKNRGNWLIFQLIVGSVYFLLPARKPAEFLAAILLIESWLFICLAARMGAGRAPSNPSAAELEGQRRAVSKEST